MYTLARIKGIEKKRNPEKAPVFGAFWRAILDSGLWPDP